MIISRSIIRIAKGFGPSLRARIKLPLFSTFVDKDTFNKLTSPETFHKFQQLLEKNTFQSLEEAAELLATLEVETEKSEEAIKHFQEKLDICPSHVKQLIQKIQIVKNNIDLQVSQNEAIEKRVQKQIDDCKNFSVSSIARQFLDMADSISKCKKMAIDYHRSEDHEVVQEILKADRQMKSIFQRYGIKQFDPTGEYYDPNTQQALITTPTASPEHKNRVEHTMRTGYTIKGRLLRSAHVSVFK